jgi:hypothetical protein
VRGRRDITSSLRSDLMQKGRNQYDDHDSSSVSKDSESNSSESSYKDAINETLSDHGVTFSVGHP